MLKAPAAGAARSQPKPVGPTRRMSSAKIGNRYTAPPSNTANMSSEIIAKIRRVSHTNRIPSNTECQEIRPGRLVTRRSSTWNSNATNANEPSVFRM